MHEGSAQRPGMLISPTYWLCACIHEYLLIKWTRSFLSPLTYCMYFDRKMSYTFYIFIYEGGIQLMKSIASKVFQGIFRQMSNPTEVGYFFRVEKTKKIKPKQISEIYLKYSNIPSPSFLPPSLTNTPLIGK